MVLFKNVVTVFFFIIISTLSSAVYADVPPTSCIATADTESELSLSYWATQEASLVMCSHGYWALSDDKDYATLGKLHYATALYLGRGTERNVDEAMKWFREAADEGDTDAKEFLRTGSHAADRDVEGRSVGLQYEAKKLSDTKQVKETKQSLAQHLIPVATDAPLPSELEEMNGKIIWSLIIIILLIVIGALYQAIRSHQLVNKGV